MKFRFLCVFMMIACTAVPQNDVIESESLNIDNTPQGLQEKPPLGEPIPIPTPDLAALPLTERVEKLLRLRCLYCHQQTPSFLFPAGGVVLSSTEDFEQHRERIYQRTVVDKDMPPQPTMTEEERQWVKQWYESF